MREIILLLARCRRTDVLLRACPSDGSAVQPARGVNHLRRQRVHLLRAQSSRV